MKKEKQQKRPKRTKAQRVQALKTFAVDTVYDVVGSILFAIGVYTFAKSADFAPGGVSGLALICNYLWDLPIGTMTLIINIPIIIISYKVVGRKFLLKSFKTMVISTLFLDLVFPLTPLYTGNSFLAAIFSGVFMGAGLALIYMRGSSTGGTDFLIVTIKKLKPHFSMGQVTLMTDLVVIVLGGFVFGNIDAVLYGVISTYAASVIIDKIIYGAGSGKLAIIITTDAMPLRRRSMRKRAGVQRLSRPSVRIRALSGILFCVPAARRRYSRCATRPMQWTQRLCDDHRGQRGVRRGLHPAGAGPIAQQKSIFWLRSVFSAGCGLFCAARESPGGRYAAGFGYPAQKVQK